MRLEDEEDGAGGVEGDVPQGDVPVVGDGGGGGEPRAWERVEGCDEGGGVHWCFLLCRVGRWVGWVELCW